MSRKSAFPFFIIITLILVPLSVGAHVSIPTAPTTSCGSLDSTNLKVHTSNQIDGRLVGKSNSTDWKLFTTSGMGDGTTYLRNTGVWTSAGSSSIDWTGISPYNTSGGYHAPGTLISPRHVLMATHYSASVGAKMIFVDSSNTVYERTVFSIQSISGTDINVGVLDSDVPDSITYYAVIASSTLSSVLQKFTTGGIDVPIISFDQEKKAIARSMNTIGTSITHNVYSTTSRATFSEDIVSGDSGNPNFILIDNQAVLIGSHRGAGSFPNLGAYISQINSAMTSLGGGYQLTEYTPLTCFDNYAPINNVPSFSGASYGSLALNQFGLATSTVVRTYTATDADVSQTLSFSLVSLTSNSTTTSLGVADYFSLSSSTGALRQIQTIDTDIFGRSLSLVVRVSDNGTYVGSTTVTNPIYLHSIDGNAPIDIDSDFVSTSTDQTAVKGLIAAPDGSLYFAPNVTVDFRGYPSLKQGNIVKIKTDGSIDTTYINNQGIGATSTTATGIIIQNLYLDANSRVVAVGSFKSFGTATSSGITRLNTDGTLDTAFASNTGSGLSSGVIVKVVPVGNKIMAVGTFSSSTFNGVTVRRLLLLNDDGTINADFSNTASSSISGFLNTSSNDFIPYSDTQVLIGGIFSSYNGTATGRIARINIDGTLDVAFNTALGTGFNTSVTALGKLSDGRIIVGGVFTALNGTSTPNIVKLNTDGSLNSAFVTNVGTGPNISSGLVISIQSDDKIVIGGSFTSFNGVNTPNTIVRLNSDGTIDSTFTDGLGLGYTGPTVNMISLKRFSDNRLAVYGNYQQYNNTPVYGPHILETSIPPAVASFALATSSDSGQYSDDKITQNTTVTFGGSGTPAAVMYLEENGDTVGTTTVDVNGDWSATVTLSEGSKSILAFQTLSVLNTATSSDSETISLTIDATAPGINGLRVAHTNNILLDFTESIATSSLTSTSDWTVLQNGSPVTVSSVTMIGSAAYLTLSSDLSAGSSVTASYSGTGLEDVAGNQLSAFSAVSVTNNTPTVTTTSASQSSAPVVGQTGGGSGGGTSVVYTTNVTATSTPIAGVCAYGVKFNTGTGQPCPVIVANNTQKIKTTLYQEQVQPFNIVYKPNPDVIALKFRSISVGAVGVDVLELQRFLNNNNFLVSNTGVGSKGKETRYFGTATRNALVRFQKAVGITPAVGYFGPVTKKYILSK
jgi:uncharacterized delta-60 repeat protein